MINLGLVLLVAAGLLAGMGAAGYLSARRSTSKSRYAALSLFGHGALSSSGALAFLLLFHIHGMWPFSIHVHNGSETLAEILACDLEVSCAALTILALTGIVVTTSFFVSQGSARLLLRRYSALADPAATSALVHRKPLPSGTRLLVVADPDADAFSLAILRLDPRRLFRAEDVVVLTSGLLKILTADEADAVLAHELAHVTARDDRYLPFFRVLSILMFFDPILRFLRRRVGRHHELAADAESSRRTGRPVPLARALLKVYLHGSGVPRASGLFGGKRCELLERINALLALDAELQGGRNRRYVGSG